MNTLKMLLVFAILGGVGYGVYTRLNSRPDPAPPVDPAAWGTAPSIQMPGQSTTGAPSSLGTPGPPSAVPGMPSAAPAFPPHPEAPDNLTSAFERSRAPGDAAGLRNPTPGVPPVPPGGFGAPGSAPPYPDSPPPLGPTAAMPPYPTTGGDPAPGSLGSPVAPGLQPPLPPGSDDNRYPSGPGAVAAASRGADPRGGQPPVDYGRNPQNPPEDLRAAGNNLIAAADGLRGAAEGLRGAAVGEMRDAASQAKEAATAQLKGIEANASSAFNSLLDNARRELDAGRMAEVHRLLSAQYDNARLSQFEQQRLTELLDQLAGTIVYSTQSLLEEPYEVQKGERLEDIGERYNVPWQLLAKINGIDDPQTLQPGEKLKVVKGPFSATVSLEKRQLTLMLGELYAGRFPIGVGREYPPVEGTYLVAAKNTDPTYHGTDRAIEGRDPANPLGNRLIGLGNQLGIHGTNDPANVGRTDLKGCISLSPRDIEDVYDILSYGSKVTIRR